MLIFQTSKEYERDEADNGKSITAAKDPGPVTIFFAEVIASGNPLEEFVVKAYEPMLNTEIETPQIELSVFGDISKFADSKYVVIVSQGHSKSIYGYGAIQIAIQGEGLSWSQTNISNPNIEHTADDTICFVIELSKLLYYNKFLEIPSGWAQFIIKYYTDGINDLSAKAVLLVAEGAGTIFDGLTDKIDLKENSSTIIGFASKSIDVTGLYE
jgi:hypothetical protein